jgi:hypothetical protein
MSKVIEKKNHDRTTELELRFGVLFLLLVLQFSAFRICGIRVIFGLIVEDARSDLD